MPCCSGPREGESLENDCADIESGAHPPAGALVTANRLCVRCGYSLRGLDVTAKCPECGANIADSLANLLVHGEPRYLERLQQGLRLIQGAIAVLTVTAPAVLIVEFWLTPPHHVVLFCLLFMGLAGALIAPAMVLIRGGWLVSCRDAHVAPPSSDDRPRLLARGAVFMGIAMMVLALGLGALPGGYSLKGLRGAVADSMLALSGATLAFAILWMFASAAHFHSLARRIPDHALARRWWDFSWIAALLFTVGALFVLGPLNAVIFYWFLLRAFRETVAKVRLEQAATASP